MNESDLEDELRQLRPHTPSAGLEKAIASRLALETAPAPAPVASRAGVLPRVAAGISLSQLLSRLLWAAGGAAATALLIFTLRPATPASMPLTPFSPLTQPIAATNAVFRGFEPAESSRELIGAEDGGLLLDGNDGPTKVVRYSSVERHSWLDPQTGARVEVEAPRVDVVYLPVSVQ